MYRCCMEAYENAEKPCDGRLEDLFDPIDYEEIGDPSITSSDAEDTDNPDMTTVWWQQDLHDALQEDIQRNTGTDTSLRLIELATDQDDTKRLRDVLQVVSEADLDPKAKAAIAVAVGTRLTELYEIDLALQVHASLEEDPKHRDTLGIHMIEALARQTSWNMPKDLDPRSLVSESRQAIADIATADYGKGSQTDWPAITRKLETYWDSYSFDEQMKVIIDLYPTPQTDKLYEDCLLNMRLAATKEGVPKAEHAGQFQAQVLLEKLLITPEEDSHKAAELLHKWQASADALPDTPLGQAHRQRVTAYTYGFQATKAGIRVTEQSIRDHAPGLNDIEVHSLARQLQDYRASTMK